MLIAVFDIVISGSWASCGWAALAVAADLNQKYENDTKLLWSIFEVGTCSSIGKFVRQNFDRVEVVRRVGLVGWQEQLKTRYGKRPQGRFPKCWAES